MFASPGTDNAPLNKRSTLEVPGGALSWLTLLPSVALEVGPGKGGDL
jgi:hypothetical protein